MTGKIVTVLERSVLAIVDPSEIDHIACLVRSW